MKARFMGLLMWSSRLLGIWFLRAVAAMVASGYFVFRPKRVAASRSLYAAIFPKRSPLFHLYCAWRQFMDLAASYSDRLSLEAGSTITHTTEGSEHLETAARAGRGAVILMSHMGNWEVGARLFRRKGLKMMIFMAERDPREVARGQMKDLETEGLQVSVASGQAPSVFAGLEALEFLQSGGFVAIAGDLAWTEQRRRAKVSLFGHEARLPAAPHLLALLSGAPLITVFSVRRAKGAYHFIVSKPRKVTAKGGVHRQLAVERSARAYARELEIVVRQHPWQWHIFESILGPPLVGEELGGALLGAEVSDGQDG